MFKFHKHEFSSVINDIKAFPPRRTEYYSDKFHCGMKGNMVIKNVQIYRNFLREREVFQIVSAGNRKTLASSPFN